MLTIGALSFTTPWLLAGFVILPVLWWLLRVSPPAPRRVPFPALRLLLGLDRDEETPARMPPWLLALRAALAAFVLLALAGPLWNAANYSARTGPLVLVVDTGWAAAPGWRLRDATLSALIEEAVRENRPVVLLPTASARPPAITLMAPGDARRAAAALTAQPYAPDRQALLDRLPDLASLLDGAETVGRESDIIWLSDGLDYGAARPFAETLSAIAPLTVLGEAPGRLALALERPETEGTALRFPVLRPIGAAARARTGTLSMKTAEGRTIATARYSFDADAVRTLATLDLPVDLRNQAARVELDGMRSAGGVVLLDSSWRRRPVGLVSGAGGGEERPLLSDLYYLRRALEPYADLRGESVGDLIAGGLSVLILSDVGQIVGEDQASVATWVEDGGVLIRFAGPRLAQRSDALIPVPLRRGGRALGGTLSWETPQGLAPFADDSPFAGLEATDEIVVERQVLAEPGPDLEERIWARLEDGTPLVTATRRGTGWLVLIHVTAGPEWSSLPLSGLYVQMLRRLIDLSQGIADAGGTSAPGTALAPIRVLTGAGTLELPGPAVQPLTRDALNQAPDAAHPPGLYGREGALRAYNMSDGPVLLRAQSMLDDLATTGGYLRDTATDLRPWLGLLALVALIADLIATVVLTGQGDALRRKLFPGIGAVALVIVLPVLSMGAMPAQAQQAVAATLETRLAYVRTGNAASDTLTAQGLASLSRVLFARTAFEPGDAVAVDPAQDDLVFYPLLYWRVTPGQAPLSPQALRRIDTYMKNGGTILFDTADQGDPLTASGVTAAQGALRLLLRDLDVPPLAPVPQDHVLRKAFYLLDEFPGRYAGADVWVEAPQDGAAPSRHDGVSPIIIGAADWAGAWARDADGRPLVATAPGGERQRELAYRFGVNLVMYTLSGNYKADQVHVPAILERLGR